MQRQLQYVAVMGILGIVGIAAPSASASDYDSNTFTMVVSAGAKTCLPKATATVRVRPAGPIDIMDVTVEGLPANTEFDFFVLQVPKTPFGVAWYQGDIMTDRNGRGHQEFVGRFNIETFSVAQSTAPAPVVFNNGALPDASLNPPFNPIQMYHLGLWFGSPQAASAAGCPATVTPFNGEHNAGIQVLNTSNFADDQGPLRSIQN
ncbi:MAG TPA: hypothetical protein VKU19_14265 [Bryobacteraceae bacterium]|nr:hypothetical protein [Bryobacteraceae bacterium]